MADRAVTVPITGPGIKELLADVQALNAEFAKMNAYGSASPLHGTSASAASFDTAPETTGFRQAKLGAAQYESSGLVETGTSGTPASGVPGSGHTAIYIQSAVLYAQNVTFQGGTGGGGGNNGFGGGAGRPNSGTPGGNAGPPGGAGGLSFGNGAFNPSGSGAGGLSITSILAEAAKYAAIAAAAGWARGLQNDYTFGSARAQDNIQAIVGKIPGVGAGMAYDINSSRNQDILRDTYSAYGRSGAPTMYGYAPDVQNYAVGQATSGFGVNTSVLNSLNYYRKSPALLSSLESAMGTDQSSTIAMMNHGFGDTRTAQDAYYQALGEGNYALANKLAPVLGGTPSAALIHKRTRAAYRDIRADLAKNRASGNVFGTIGDYEQTLGRILSGSADDYINSPAASPAQDAVLQSLAKSGASSTYQIGLSQSRLGVIGAGQSQAAAFGNFGVAAGFIGQAATEQQGQLSQYAIQLQNAQTAYAQAQKAGNTGGMQAAAQQISQIQATMATLQSNVATAPLTQGQTIYQGKSAIATASTSTAQAGLGAATATGTLYDPHIATLYKEVRGGLESQITALQTLIRSEASAGASDAILAPLRSQLSGLRTNVAQLAVQQFQQTYSDMAVAPQAQSQIASARLGINQATGQGAGAGFASAEGGRARSAMALYSVANQKYQAALRNYGASSSITIAAAVERENAFATVASTPGQISSDYAATAGAGVSSAQSFAGAAASMTAGGGYGTAAALPYQQLGVNAAGQQVTIAQNVLSMDRTSGQGPTRIAADQAAIAQASLGAQSGVLAMGNFGESAGYNIRQQNLSFDLYRASSSYAAPGNVFDIRTGLLNQAKKGLTDLRGQESQVDAYIRQHPEYAYLRPQFAQQFNSQEMGFKQQEFDQANALNDNYMDRLQSSMQNGTSFYGRMKPTLAQAAGELDSRTDIPENFRQYRGFGFVSDRGAAYERNRGAMTAGGSDVSFFPGDIATQAMAGNTSGGRYGGGSPIGGPMAGKMLNAPDVAAMLPPAMAAMLASGAGVAPSGDATTVLKSIDVTMKAILTAIQSGPRGSSPVISGPIGRQVTNQDYSFRGPGDVGR